MTNLILYPNDMLSVQSVDSFAGESVSAALCL